MNAEEKKLVDIFATKYMMGTGNHNDAEAFKKGALFAMSNLHEPKLSQIRTAVSDYIASEGCSCCRDIDGHEAAMERIGKMLKMAKYSDGTGFDYSLYKSE